MKADLINNLIKHSVVKTVLNKDSKVAQTNGAMQAMINMQTNYSKENMFTLPDMPSTSKAQIYISDNGDEDDSNTSVELSPRKQSKWMGNIHSVDVTSNEFKALPADVRYDILTDLKETRKQNSWGRLHEIPQVCMYVQVLKNYTHTHTYIFIYLYIACMSKINCKVFYKNCIQL